ncbi:acyl-CoA dehydrogenase family protein [Gordonia sp. GONU]|uniref:acyl-CoA dehydrogenase family protein n=1 Tax=Gordonia TaxID=2053 RepID=UPI000404FF86|nr:MULTISPECIES: acyl-CoA dehydrogenase family protein [Gordonia]MCR8896046.1 acyl-CoA dehydrogenase family protein [Gordonia sp. GONU]MCZ4650592.1 acyl-CoA dehydrogenase family protein [Gordonia amicalis]
MTDVTIGTRESVAGFVDAARDWIESQGRRLAAGTQAEGWGTGSDDVSVFHALSDAEERALIAERCAWERAKYDAGYGAITWPVADGGQGLAEEFEAAFADLESAYDVPAPHELVGVTINLIGPTLRLLASGERLRSLIAPMMRAEILACQLFSEPGAGSDLAALGTKAVRDGDEWVLDGQKVWTSGAQFADWGEILVRTDPTVPKHKGMTAFMIPMDTPGVEIRPLQQMTGGSSFNEVFLDNVRLTDDLRIGEVGDGWKVGLTTLGFERGASSDMSAVGGSARQCRELAAWSGADQDPIARQRLAAVLIGDRLADIAVHRDRADANSGNAAPGAIGSIRKMQWVNRLSATSEFARAALGRRLAVDSGEWGTFAWHQHVLGAPGYRIAGGSDEIQRNIIGERILGLPAEPRVDKNTPWSAIPR